MLNPYRKSLIQSVRSYETRPREGKEPPPANFFPCPAAGIPASHIDYVAEQLNARNWIDAGLIPVRQLVANDIIFMRHQVEPKIKLRDEFELARDKKGYWNVTPVKLKIVDRPRTGSIRSMAEALENV